MHAAIHTDPTEPALGAMFVAGGTTDSYIDGASRSGIAEEPVEGMVMHWSAQLADGMITGTLWRERGLAEHFLSEVLANTFTQMSAPESGVRPRPDYSYELSSIVAFSAGDDAGLALGRELGGAAGAVLVRATEKRAEVELRGDAPAGMIAHVAAIDGAGVRWVDIWLDRAAHRGFYEKAGIDPAGLETVVLHTLLVNRDELARLPRYPRMR